MPFMYIRNSRGQRTYSWGVPNVISHVEPNGCVVYRFSEVQLKVRCVLGLRSISNPTNY